MPRARKGDYRIDAVVETEEEREMISAAAIAAQQSVRVFVGQAALMAASPKGRQIARLEHVTQAQERLIAELETLKQKLQELSANLTKVVDTSTESVMRHAETHRQLAIAIEQRENLQLQLSAALSRQKETHVRLMAMIPPIESTSRAVSEGLDKINEVHARTVSPDEMDSVRMTCRMMARIIEHLGIKLEDEE